jgi:hypothetical protein
MLDEMRPLDTGLPGDDRQPPRGLPPEAPLAMPAQVLERRRRRSGGWLRRLMRRRAG